MLVGITAALAVEYLPRAYYRELRATVDSLDRKNYMAEVVEEPSFEEGRFTHDLLHTANKAMLDEIAIQRERESEYREHIELWVHEIKAPIASAKLIAKNNPSDATDSMLAEVERVEDLKTALRPSMRLRRGAARVDARSVIMGFSGQVVGVPSIGWWQQSLGEAHERAPCFTRGSCAREGSTWDHCERT